MSILFPSDPADRPSQRSLEARARRKASLVAGLRKLGLWPMFLQSDSILETSGLISRSGKIRLVTSHWVDRPSRKANRRKDKSL